MNNRMRTETRIRMLSALSSITGSDEQIAIRRVHAGVFMALTSPEYIIQR